MRRPEFLRRASFFTLFPLVVGVFAIFIASVSAYVPFQQARRIAGQEATNRAADKASVGVNLLHEQQRSLVGFARATAQQLGETGDGPADELALDTFISRLSQELQPVSGAAAATDNCLSPPPPLPAAPDGCGAGVLAITREISGVPASTLLARAGALMGTDQALGRWLVLEAVKPPAFDGNPADGVPWMFASYPVLTAAGAPTGITVVAAQPNIVDDLALELRSAGTDQPQVAIVRNDRYLVGGRIAGRRVQPGDRVAPALAQVPVTGAITADIDGDRYAVAASLLGDGARLLIVSPVVSDPGALITPGLVISWASIVIILLLVTGHFFTRHWQMLRGAEARAAVATHLDAPRPLSERLEAVCRQLIATTRAGTALIVIGGAELPAPYVCHVGLDRPDALRLLGKGGPLGDVAALRHRRTKVMTVGPHTEEARCGMTLVCAAPLIMGSGLRGVVAIADRPRGFIDADRVQLSDAAERLAFAVERDRILSVRTIEASTDPLTGLPNRRSLVEHLDRQLAIAERARSPLSVLMLDLDRLKEINDTHGHAAGDEALRVFARTVSSTVRRADLAARISGDEFVIVMANTRGRDARDVAEKVRIAVASVEVRVGASRTPVRLGVSIGGVSFPEVRGGAERLLERADAALYEAKREGRNRVRFDGPGRISVA
ncbi:MAG TPA: GGDEF domain-containing protein [Candidatus Dormibacteraeota bacterium]|nr:GGDEF domain-containing protein [Candidatus Dormibacteraeota bacterium]